MLLEPLQVIVRVLHVSTEGSEKQFCAELNANAKRKKSRLFFARRETVSSDSSVAQQYLHLGNLMEHWIEIELKLMWDISFIEVLM